MSETQSLRYWFALIVSSIIAIVVAFAIIGLSWYLLVKYVLCRFGVIRALFQLNSNDQKSDRPRNEIRQAPAPPRRQQVRRE